MATRNIVPRADNEGGIGTTSKRWADVETVKLNNALCQVSNAYITSATVTTTQTSLQSITGFSFAIAASEVWCFELWMNVGSSSAAGLEFGINGPSGGLPYGFLFGTTSGNTAFKGETITALNTATTAFNTGGITTAAAGAYATLNGTFVNSTNAGTVQFQFLKVTSGTATIYGGSYMCAWRLA